MIIKVAVPLLKHSPRLGQAASSQTEASLCLRSLSLIDLICLPAGILTRIQSGFFGSSVVGMTFTGMRATLSAPRSFSPCTTFLAFAFSSLISFNLLPQA